MKRVIMAVLAIAINFSYSLFAQDNKIILEIESDEDSNVDYTLLVNEVDSLEITQQFKEIKLIQSDYGYKCSLRADKPLILSASSKLPFRFPDYSDILLLPGDSIHIQKHNREFILTGRGGAQFLLLYKISTNTNNQELADLFLNRTTLDSLQDFFIYKKEIESWYEKRLIFLNEQRQSIAKPSFSYLRDYYFNTLQFYLGVKFMQVVVKRKLLNLSNKDLSAIYDTSLAKYQFDKDNAADTMSLVPLRQGLDQYIVIGHLRSKNFTISDNDLERRVSRYYYAKQMLTGLAQRKILAHILTFSILRKSTEPGAIEVTNDFLSLTGYPEYRDYVKNYLEVRLGFQKGKSAPAFSLITANDQPFSLADLKGKIVFMDFWFSGCKGCVQVANAMRQVEKIFENNSKVEFLSICTDKSKSQWQASIAKAKYTTGTAINAYTSGLGRKHPIIKDYNVTAYPATFLLDAEGKFIQPVPDPRKDNGKALIAFIKRLLPPTPEDGPYVLHKDGRIISKSIDADKEEKPVVKEGEIKHAQTMEVHTDIAGKTFTVKLKGKLEPEASIYEQPSKVLALSDIEGEFMAFRELLQANRVIDENFNWTFGDGHLVLAGDFFDRGQQVTEVLWLIYSLEEKAKAKGGYVHFILGNHEIMNLSGDTRYVQQKYKDNAALLGEDYVTGLYGDNSELGRWLRTKSIMEKIGDVLYCHAGISSAINNFPLTLPEINNLVRPHYAGTIKPEDANLKTIMSSKVGPYWYRGYYQDKGASESQIDSTLQKFDVNKIVTGHTIIGEGDKVTAHFNNKVINTDTEHAEGKSEALLIEGDKFYRVNAEGNKVLLFIDEQNK